MKKIAIILWCLPLLFGCVASKAIKAKSISEKNVAFSEVRDGETLLRGFAELVIEAEVKTHVEGFYVLESGESCHGKSAYPFLLNIDGQAVSWQVEGKREDTPRYDDRGLRIPDGGEGVRYNLTKKLRLPSGVHRLFFAFPSDNVYKEAEITLAEGSYLIVFSPHYKRDRYIEQNYLKGVNYLDMTFKEIRLCPRVVN